MTQHELMIDALRFWAVYFTAVGICFAVGIGIGKRLKNRQGDE